ncbi:hypothetical protein E2553_17505 [Paraburkholderia dipogonis]|uniref:Uncharacterized protein n=2 Tax=Paraburkholderia dipogonis TaxID=1211383 RepID=A0A4Y8NA50_9BURK|nr:hypothetical protein [Paraburkholderia dipogonis]TFE46677.1 hypothetical protein E2553_17505 [Paraburkholderia dipogonis]
MSTIPFTPIQGYLAMPRLRPLGHVPASFGRDWALLPPGYSLRAELKALYAAMLRTFCMSDQAIRSLCRWSPSVERRATEAPAPVFEKRVDAAAQIAAAAAAVPPILPRVPATGVRGPGHHWSALAGGACVLGGTAMLGWIGFDHLMHRDTATHMDFAGKVSYEQDSRSAKALPLAAVTARTVDNAAARTSAAVAASTPAFSNAAPEFARASRPAAASVPVPASNSATTLRFASAHVVADKTVSHRRQPVREESRKQVEQIHPRTARLAVASQSPHATTSGTQVQRSAPPEVAVNASPKLSAAGAYSPVAPARLGVDEYAGVSMFAATHVRDIAPMPRTSSSNNSSSASGTEWMNHLSQRRLTDVPDQFAK